MQHAGRVDQPSPVGLPPSRWVDLLISLLALLLFVASWEAISRLGVVSKLILPAPSAVAWEFLRMLGNIGRGGYMLKHVIVTIIEILAGFLVGGSLGFGLGVVIAESALARRILLPYIVALNAAPKIALAPLLVVWFGFGMSSKIVMAALISFFPLLVNVIAGLTGVEPDKLKLMRSLAATRVTTFMKVKLPDALPVIFAGGKTAIVLAVVGAVVGEFVGADVGLGHIIKMTDYQLDVAETFAAILLLSLIGIVLFYLAEYLERWVVFWRRSGPA